MALCACVALATPSVATARYGPSPDVRPYDGPTATAAADTADERPVASSPVEDDADPGPALDDEFDDGPDLHDTRDLTRAGIGMTIVGGVLGLGAVFLFALDPCDEEPGNDCRKTERRNAALSVGVPAAALAVAGITTLIVGKVRQRRLSAGVGVGRTGAAISVTARF